MTIGFLGAGSFATGILLPAIKRCGRADLITVCCGTGPNSQQASRKFGFSNCTTNEDEIFANSDLNTIVIATRHHLHARQVVAGIGAGKHVFCEKPLCLTETELSDIVCAYMSAGSEQKGLMVGFNRRFAPMVVRMKEFLSKIREPLSLNYRINAGYLPRDHWVHDPEQGGGRISGEACHFVDLLGFLAGSQVAKVSARSLPDKGRYSGDNLAITLEFQNGSQGVITYIANGDKSFSKERLEIFGGGAAAVLEDFRRLELRSRGRSKVLTSRWTRDKGHVPEWKAFAASILDTGPPPIPFTEIVASTLATQLAARSAMTGEALTVDVSDFISRSLDAVSPSSYR
jgi:predicted dehydrogenase